MLGGGLLLAACGVDHENAGEVAEEVATTTQAIAACEGDDALYDYNAFAASLAVAIADELGRWDASTDFEVRYGKLELSNTGTAHCSALGASCHNITALLRLQDDAASVVPNHSPSVYRSKLLGWYQKQTQKLTELVNDMLTVDKGLYKLKVRHNGKYMAVDNGSTSDYAYVEQRGSVIQAGADQWRLILQNTKHVFKNVRSGKCLSLATDSQNDLVNLVQKTCSTSASTQGFEFAQTDTYFAIRTKYGKALDVNGASYSDDARVVQYAWGGSKANQQWALEPVGERASRSRPQARSRVPSAL